MWKRILFILTLVTSTLFARTVTLDEAISLAMKNAKNVKAAEKDIEIAKLDLSSAFKTALPSVVYSGQYQKGENKRNMIKKEENFESKSGYTQSIGITQPLFQGGSIIGVIKGAKIYESTYRLQYAAEIRDTRLNAIKTYSTIVKDKRDLEAFYASKKEIEARYLKQKIQLDMRLITKTDLLKTEYALLDVESKIIGSSNNIKVEKENLKLQIGIDSLETIEVVSFDVPDSLSATIDFDKDKNQAKEKSIEALIAKNSVDLVGVQKVIVRADMLPKIDAFGKYGTFVEEKKYRDSVDDGEWRAGISVNWNIFQFGKDYDRYRAKDIEEEREVIKESKVKDEIDLKVTSSYLDILKFEKVKDSKYKAMLASEENYKMDKERYDTGLISTIDFLASENQWRDSIVEYNGVINDYYYYYEKYRSLLI
ncbi:MAG: TolC family protein [Fusobacteriaceae bacterium]